MKAALYLRISTTGQDLDLQLEELRRLAARGSDVEDNEHLRAAHWGRR